MNPRIKTITTLFLLPCLGIPAKKLVGSGFINAYLGDVFYEEGEEVMLYLLFQPEDGKSLGNLIHEYDDIVTNDYDYPDGYVVVVCKFPKQWMTDYLLVLEGKYSKLSRQFMNTISILPTEREVKNYGYDKSYPHMVYTKDELVKEGIEISLDVKLPKGSEVLSIPDMEREILNIRNFVEI